MIDEDALSDLEVLDGLFPMIDKYNSTNLKKDLERRGNVHWDVLIKADPIKAFTIVRKYNLAKELVDESFVAILAFPASDFDALIETSEISIPDFRAIVRTQERLRVNAQQALSTYKVDVSLPLCHSHRRCSRCA